MTSTVYFIGVNQKDDVYCVANKFKKLLAESCLLDYVKSQSKVGIKIHFGEEANTGYVKPDYVKILCDELKKKSVSCFIGDTNTLYRGRRTNSKDHLELAKEHGFFRENLGVEILVPDENFKENISLLKVGGKFIKNASVASVFVNTDNLIGVAHFKGHILTGFGGALKNIGMGCASRSGKLEQHSSLCPVVRLKKCTGCKACFNICPAKAVSMENQKSKIHPDSCVGCASCIAVCKSNAIDVDWESGSETIQYKMIEYAKAVISRTSGNNIFINFAIKITKECDCIAKDDPRISPDIGIFASLDPVALDTACLDAVNRMNGKNVFVEVHPNRSGMIHLEYAQSIGLGNLEYELVEIK